MSCSVVSAVLPIAGSEAEHDVLRTEGMALAALGERLPGLLVLDLWPAAACVASNWQQQSIGSMQAAAQPFFAWVWSAAPEEQSGVLTAVEEAVRVEGRRLQNADNRPAVPPAQVRLSTVLGICAGVPASSSGQSAPAQPDLCLPISSSMFPALHGLSTLTCASGVLQGWLRLLRALWRLLLFFAGTSLMDVAAALGFPPFQAMLLCTLLICHWVVVALVITVVLCPLTIDALAIIALVLNIVLALGAFTQEVSARQNAVTELQSVATDAAALLARLPAQAQLASLHAALAAWANCCADTLQHDKARLDTLRNHRFAGLRLV